MFVDDEPGIRNTLPVILKERQHDGFDVVRALKKMNPEAVMIILTAYPDVDSAITGIREQVDDYVVKPSSPDALVSILANSLAKKATQNRIAEPGDALPDYVH